MRAWRWIVILAGLLGGCGAQTVLLESPGEYLFLVSDALTTPDEPVDIAARLQAGDLLQYQSGAVVWFLRDGKLIKAAQTDRNGWATIVYVPQQIGLNELTVQVAPAGLAGEVPPPRSPAGSTRCSWRIRVPCRTRRRSCSGWQAITR
jgi:hypothetical protein